MHIPSSTRWTLLLLLGGCSDYGFTGKDGANAEPEPWVEGPPLAQNDGSDDGLTDGGSSGSGDEGAGDAGISTPGDEGGGADGGASDGGSSDGGSGDGGTSDGGSSDGGTSDGGTSDGGGSDGGTTDGGSTDGGSTDGSAVDTGAPPSGVDTGAPPSGADTGAPPSGADTGAPAPDPGDADFCAYAAATSGYLDLFQTAADGKVVFCHWAGSGFVVIDTSISACIPHLGHTSDVLPSTLCDS
ncbi:MAG: hypothetical protein JNM72_28210 [Deltaproteobacteria bacterium]|nr:hypothetical protein [Deltaproteobacteria bacterium]